MQLLGKYHLPRKALIQKKEIAIASDEIKESTSYYTPCAFEGADIEFVIIGGRKWATRNLGATTVTEYGKLYSWGNLTGQSGDSGFSPSFTSSNYTGTEGGNISSASGWDKTKHDAAYNELGGSWRMPNKDDFTALANACKVGGYSSGIFSPTGTKESFAEVTTKGVYWINHYNSGDNKTGLVFCDGTNMLFFPAAGEAEGAFRYYVGSYGYYWSSTYNNAEVAYNLSFYCNHYIYVRPQFDDLRWYGFSVRPVSD